MPQNARFAEELNLLADGLGSGSISTLDGVMKFANVRLAMEASLGQRIGTGFAALPANEVLAEAFRRAWSALNESLLASMPLTEGEQRAAKMLAAAQALNPLHR